MYASDLPDLQLTCTSSFQVEESRRADSHRNPGTDPRTRYKPAVAFGSRDRLRQLVEKLVVTSICRHMMEAGKAALPYLGLHTDVTIGVWIWMIP